MKVNDFIKEDSDFEFWFPAEIEKASDGKDDDEKFDPENMFLKGIASTEDLDLDEQIMKTNGLDIDYLTNSGFINWHHQSKTIPSAIIGEPVEAKIVNSPTKGLFIKAKLYNTETGVDAYKLAKMLEKQSKKRRLGWSIEGKIVEKDGNVITKARITGVALTHAPKNSNTFAELCKAMIDGSTTEKLQSNINNNSRYIIETNAGIFNISKDGDLHFTEKAIDTGTGAALRKEDLEGAPKKLKNPLFHETLKKVLNKYPDITFEKALKVTNKVLSTINNN